MQDTSDNEHTAGVETEPQTEPEQDLASAGLFEEDLHNDVYAFLSAGITTTRVAGMNKKQQKNFRSNARRRYLIRDSDNALVYQADLRKPNKNAKPGAGIRQKMYRYKVIPRKADVTQVRMLIHFVCNALVHCELIHMYFNLFLDPER